MGFFQYVDDCSVCSSVGSCEGCVVFFCLYVEIGCGVGVYVHYLCACGQCGGDGVFHQGGQCHGCVVFWGEFVGLFLFFVVYQSFQKTGVKSTSTENSSSRPMSMSVEMIHLAASGSVAIVCSGLCSPKLTPILLSEEIAVVTASINGMSREMRSVAPMMAQMK